jgi:hypothetical protein
MALVSRMDESAPISWIGEPGYWVTRGADLRA